MQVEIALEGDQNRILHYTSIHNRGHDRPSGEERRNPKSICLEFTDLVKRLAYNGLISDVAQSSFESLGKLLEAAAKASLIEDSHLSKIMAWFDHLICERPKVYNEIESKVARQRQEILDFVGTLSESGLLSSSLHIFKPLIEASDSQGLAVIRDAALYETALAFQDRAEQAAQGQAIPGELKRCLDAVMNPFQKTCLTLLQRCFDCTWQGEPDNPDLLIATKSTPGLDNQAAVKFCLHNKLNNAETAGADGARFLYKLALLFLEDPTPTDITSSAWFKELAQAGKLVTLKNCRVENGSLIVSSGEPPACLENITISGSSIRLEGQFHLKNIKISDSRVLFKNCSASTFQGVVIDQAPAKGVAACSASTLSGTIKDSVIGKDCAFHAYAAALDMRGCRWEREQNESANRRMRGLIFNKALVDQAFFDAVKKIKWLKAQELEQIHIQSNRAFGDRRMLAALNALGFRTEAEFKLPAASQLPPEMEGKDVRVAKAESSLGFSGSLILITPRTTEHEHMPNLSKSSYCPCIIYDRTFERGPLYPDVQAENKHATVSLLLLAILNRDDFPGKWVGTEQKHIQLTEPKPIAWPPPYEQQKEGPPHVGPTVGEVVSEDEKPLNQELAPQTAPSVLPSQENSATKKRRPTILSKGIGFVDDEEEL